MIMAYEEFNIPMIITPEDLSNPNLDEKSALTYLSYFMKEHGPGYNLIIDWLHRILPDRQIYNLTVDWNSGINFCSLLCQLGAIIPGYSKLNGDKKYWEHNVLQGLLDSQQCSIEHVHLSVYLFIQQLAPPNLWEWNHQISSRQNILPIQTLSTSAWWLFSPSWCNLVTSATNFALSDSIWTMFLSTKRYLMILIFGPFNGEPTLLRRFSTLKCSATTLNSNVFAPKFTVQRIN